MSLSSSWLGYRPFKAEARVRAPLETRYLGGALTVLTANSPTPPHIFKRGERNFLPTTHDGEKVPSVLHPVCGADA